MGSSLSQQHVSKNLKSAAKSTQQIQMVPTTQSQNSNATIVEDHKTNTIDIVDPHLYSLDFKLQHEQLYRSVINGDLDGVIEILQQTGKITLTQMIHTQYGWNGATLFGLKTIFQDCLSDASLHILKYLHEKEIDFQWQQNSNWKQLQAKATCCMHNT